MKLILQDSKIENYLKESDIIDYENELLEGYADRLVDGISNNVERIKTIYEFVRAHFILTEFDLMHILITYQINLI